MRCRSYKAVVAQLLLDGGKLASPGLSHRPASSKLAVSSRSQARASVSAAALLTLRSPQMPLAQTCLAQSRRSTQPGLYKSHAIVANSSLWIKKGTGGVRMPIPCRPSTPVAGIATRNHPPDMGGRKLVCFFCLMRPIPQLARILGPCYRIATERKSLYRTTQ